MFWPSEVTGKREPKAKVLAHQIRVTNECLGITRTPPVILEVCEACSRCGTKTNFIVEWTDTNQVSIRLCEGCYSERIRDFVVQRVSHR